MNEEVRIQDRRYNPYQGNYEKALKKFTDLDVSIDELIAD